MITMHADRLSRRELLELAMGVGGAALCGMATPAIAEAPAYRFTPPLTYGPFYPQVKLAEQDADLTHIAGASARAQGQVVHVTGRVLNQKGEPIVGARVELWQANAHGRYMHGSDKNTAPLDPNFQGFGAIETDRDGHYSFKTIKPGAYPGLNAGVRTPHIHFDVYGKVDRLVTQMFFPDQPENASDAILQDIRGGRQDLVTARILPPTKELAPDSIVALWDIVLITG